jgi:hypothetical protein
LWPAVIRIIRRRKGRKRKGIWQKSVHGITLVLILSAFSFTPPNHSTLRRLVSSLALLSSHAANMRSEAQKLNGQWSRGAESADHNWSHFSAQSDSDIRPGGLDP